MGAPSELNEVVLPQTVVGPLTRAAIFLVVCIRQDEDAYARLRAFCADLSGLIRAVEFRDVEAGLTCVAGFGSDAWDKLFGAPRPAELHPFQEIRSGGRHAVSTPGDILFHIRAKRMDLCFELATQIMDSIGDVVSVADEVHGFRYFDDRDVMGFVDGTENPRGDAAREAAIVGDEDPAFAGGSYVIVQKYLHDMKAWNALPVETQERIIGRRKLSDIELSDADKPTYAHNALTNIEENGRAAPDSAGQHAFRAAGPRRIRNLLHRLQPHAAGHRDDAAEYVRRPSAWQLRPAARLQPPRDGQPVFRAVGDVSRQRHRRRAGRSRKVRRRRPPSRRRPRLHPRRVAVRDTSLKIGSLKGEKDE